jgi:hypothetical protein
MDSPSTPILTPRPLWRYRSLKRGPLYVRLDKISILLSQCLSSCPRIEILSLQCDEGGSSATFHTLSTIDTSYKPVGILGNIIAFSDDCAETIIWNWKEETYAALRHLQDQDGIWQVRFVSHASPLPFLYRNSMTDASKSSLRTKAYWWSEHVLSISSPSQL